MDAVREFYTQPGVMSSLGSFASSAEALSRDIGGLVDIGQGLLIHEHIAPTYGVTLSEDRRGCVHVRPVERLLERVVAADSRPLFATRPAADRCGGNCRHFTVLLVALLRAQGVPARARCGFGGYFGTGLFEDHWVAEYWNDTQQRWVLVDAQLDLTQRRIFDVDFDPLDVPRDRFLTAGVAWILCRKGSADPSEFGMSVIGESGSWWIAQNLVRDVAALNNMEMLPWDVWGAMPRPPDEPISDERAEFFDRLTRLTDRPDDTFEELRYAYRDDGVRVPATVRNSVLGRDEAVVAQSSR